ncbi:hypothetical protein A2875_01865 [Candidatus Gottesmanbacteria bacterium RIFCSPHIGHO2_01_FULL_46_14]|uniref:SpoVT-AbrB domain-containing protein n=2 Tax=Candidatus Gottesmaniibacteriota TaxID=1752720 RepID=A0A1F5ZJC7_9BACT|nr:MAG: hypothetical protein A2875_01865 [Candidatus Gottesmanbacteria bacterium RIFCSPHIGHO2_01_FULL_46_14]OGG29868.1 MAG: hypothetical protein A2971_01415 [Candidatus Gottesmanbacteria bacterium RIFCSPLOWO2_01_FULL_46_21]
MQIQPIEDIIMIQPKGLMTIPKRIRKALNLEPKTIARVRMERGKMTVEPLRTLPYQVRSYTDEELKEFLALDKAEGEELRRKGIIT